MVVNTDDDESLCSTSSRRNFSMDSTSSSLRQSVGSCSAEEQQVRLFCKQRLNKRLFVGQYLERRHVEQICSYRDVVEIHKSEIEFKNDLDTLKRQLQALNIATWIGITGPRLAGRPAGHALWVKLHDTSFGQYWFQIKHVKFGDTEVLVHVKVVRPLDIFATETNKTETQQHKVTSTTQPSSNVGSTPSSSPIISQDDKDWTEAVPTLEEGALAIKKLATVMLERVAHLCVTLVTLHNIKEVFRFFVAFFVATVVGMVQSVRFTGDFSIKFMREISTFVRASTPIALGIIDFFTKMVGGFYILLAMMWRGTMNQPPAQPSYRQAYSRPALPPASQPSFSDKRYSRPPKHNPAFL